jgi:hypothetical protein
MMTSRHHVHSSAIVVTRRTLQVLSNSAGNNLFPIRKFMFVSEQVDRKRLVFVRKPNTPVIAVTSACIFTFVYSRNFLIKTVLDRCEKVACLGQWEMYYIIYDEHIFNCN